MKVDKLVPEVYYKESRDFSFIGRLLEVVFNYMKTASDNVDLNIDRNTIDSTIVDLAARTLGFQSKHKYLITDLISVVQAFTELTRNKGSKLAVESAIQLLLSSQNISDKFSVYQDKEDPNKLIIQISKSMNDIILLEDLFDYILPAGMIYVITRATVADNLNNIIDEVSVNNNYSIQDDKLGLIATTDQIDFVNGTNSRTTFDTGIVVSNITQN